MYCSIFYFAVQQKSLPPPQWGFCAALWRNICDLERNQVTGAQLAGDGQVEHCQVTLRYLYFPKSYPGYW
jgi:hypothetical protein